jgi:catechol 2,3-dioxygenase-like lactoylglutathione lyase family enzyme
MRVNRSYLAALCDHLDVRVRDIAPARRFYDPFCAALGLTEIGVGERWVSYESTDDTQPFLAITADPEHRPAGTRIAFRAGSQDDVDRIAAVARASEASAFEAPQPCPEYAPGYYAAFFDDPDGNRYEICYRPLSPTIGRLWRGRVRPGMLDEYRKYIASTGLKDYAQTDGNRGAFMLTAEGQEFGDVLTLSLWKDAAAIAAFAGLPIERARYYPEDERFLLDFPESVEHFDVTY